MSQIVFKNLVINGTIFLDGDSERIIDTLKQAKSIDLAEELDSQIVNIDDENPSNSALVFSDGLPEDPVISQGSVELVALSISEEGDISITVDLSSETIDTAVSLFDSILSIEEVHITDFDLEYRINKPFSDLNLSIDGPSEFDYRGVRFEDESYSYILQSSQLEEWGENDEDLSKSSSEEEEQEELPTSASVNTKTHFDIDTSRDFIRDHKQNVEESMELLL